MKTAKQIREEIDAARVELNAIVALATEEARELAAEEQTRVAEITDTLLPGLEKSLETRNKVDSEIKAANAARIAAELDRQMSNGGDVTAIRLPAKARKFSNLKAYDGPDAQRDAYVAGSVFLAGVYGNQHAIEFCSNHGLGGITNTMSGGISGAKGGFLVPDEMSSAIVRLREERGVFPRYANSVPMGSDNITIPRLIADVTATWTGETDEITASDATLGGAELVAKKLACLTKVSTELDEDAVVQIGDIITTSMAYAMADKIDEAGFNGDGTSTYGGVTGLVSALNAAAVQDAASGNVSAATLDLTDFEATMALLPMYDGATPRWFCHSAFYYNSMLRLSAAAGGNTITDIANGGMPMFLGYPVTFVQVMPSAPGVSTIGCYFGDLRLTATIGTRRATNTAVTTERYFEFDLIGIRSTERVAINVHERGADVRTRPMVALKNAAS